MLERLFVYGTLRDDAVMAAALGGVSAWRRLGVGTVHGVLYDLGNYPGLVTADPRGGELVVHGEVVEFDHGAAALARLDEFEDVPGGEYRRTRTAVQLSDGGVTTCWIYVYARSVAGRPPVPGGRWVVRPRHVAHVQRRVRD